MPLSECIKNTTDREYVAWSEWLNNQWEEPDRTDLYIMQLTLQVASMLSKKKMKLNDFKLEFSSNKSEKQTQASVDTSKAQWLRRVGLK